MGGTAKPTDEERRERKTSLLPAIAVSWDDQTVKILCPFCKQTHNHGFSHFAYHREAGERIQDDGGCYKYQGPSPTRNESRVPHCYRDPELVNISVSYTILFPFEEDPRVAGLSFEIDREKQRFRTLGVGVIPLSRFEEPGSSDGGESAEEESLRRAMHNMSLQEGDYGVVEKIPNERPFSITSFAITGDLNLLKQYLEDSPDPSSLLKIRSREGGPLIGLAVPNGHLEIVKYLLGQGCDIDAADINGRTPLMEAALWAHPKIVDALLKAGANKSLKDRSGMTAGNFAEDTDRNELERHTRALKYTEDPYIKKRHRLFIQALLGHSPTSPSSGAAMLSRDGSHSRDTHFYKSPSAGTISLVLPAEGVSIQSQAKTAAVLLRGEPFPPVFAGGGWGAGPSAGEFRSAEAGMERLNEEYWAFETLNLASDMGLEFETHDYDQSRFPGIYFACHAEAQLMSLFVRRNYLFSNHGEGERDVRDGFLQLFMLQPRKRAAKILVSNTPCASCRGFKERILEQLGIKFEFEELQVKT